MGAAGSRNICKYLSRRMYRQDCSAVRTRDAVLAMVIGLSRRREIIN